MAQKPDPKRSWGILPAVLGTGLVALLFTIVIGQAVVRGNPEIMPVALMLTCIPGTMWLLYVIWAYHAWKNERNR